MLAFAASLLAIGFFMGVAFGYAVLSSSGKARTAKYLQNLEDQIATAPIAQWTVHERSGAYRVIKELRHSMGAPKEPA